MNLKILLPFKVFAEKQDVKCITAEAPEGSFGLLPHRLDCVSVLAPGILTYETEEEGKEYVAIDEGILIKAGANVLISVRNAIGEAKLGKLHEVVKLDFMNLNETEKSARVELAKLESNFVRQFTKLQKMVRG